MTAGQIVNLLSEKHHKDVFVAECKDGSSWGTHLRLDAWAMARSWVHPCMYGYEVKVVRGDFLKDNKWPEYLSLCNRFSFVTPRGVIQPGELPEGVGLLEVATTGTMLRTVRKSAYRVIDQPVDLLKYILMCRSKIYTTNLGRMDDDDPIQFWRAWLTRKQDLQGVGRRVSKRLSQTIVEQIEAVQTENRRIRAENESYANIKEMLHELNLRPEGWRTKERLQEIAAEFNATVPAETRLAILRANEALAELVTLIGEKP